MDDAVQRYADELKRTWDQLEDMDKFVVGGAGVLTLAGALVAVFTRSAAPFLGGAAGGALLVGARLVTKQNAKPPQPLQAPPVKAKATQNDRLGAPVIPMSYAGPVQTFNGLVTEEEALNFPLMHRIPEADLRTDPLNEAIAPTPTAPHTVQSVTGFW